MKKRMISLLLLLALVVTALPVRSTAASARLPIYVGDLKVDYMAQTLLAQMDLAGKSDREQIQTVYDWIIYNCTRQPEEWDGTYYFDETEVANQSSGWFAQQYNADLAAGRILLRQEHRNQAGIPNYGDDYWDSDSNYYVITSAYEMMLKRNGHCGNFSALLAVLLGHLGYDSRLVYGDFVSRFGGEPVIHTWNYILIDGVYYWADVRIDDSNVAAGYANSHDYFLIEDTAHWQVEHIWEPTYTDWLAANAPVIQSYYDSAYDRAPAPATPYHCSQWATEYMQRADAMGLIPSILDGQDLTRQITRREFAAVAVRLFERLAYPVQDYYGVTPFSDTADPDVLRAYSLGVVNGMGDGTFAPDASLTREQAATMLGRVYELASTNAINGGAYLPQSYNYFLDHYNIFDYARYYVYFFVSQGIIDGMGDGTFAPKSPMTREQALKIAAETAS